MSIQRIKQATMLMVAMCALSGIAHAADDHRRDGHDGPGRGGPDNRGAVLDHRYNHDRYYPARGASIRVLPPGYYASNYRGSPYYFHGGSWYRPYRSGYVVVRPPLGISIGILPPYYSTVWFGGVPYYYADDTYYRWYPEQRAYVVTEPPASESSATVAAPATNTDVFIYPKNGQSEQQQATDRYECHSWAKKQTGFDPTQPLGGVDESQSAAKRADYQRAEGACLEARGYTVK
ncbi:MAG: DUF6515 family protein [Steroidobacteraceae bacterium]